MIFSMEKRMQETAPADQPMLSALPEVHRCRKVRNVDNYMQITGRLKETGLTFSIIHMHTIERRKSV
ncbi:hypothetical protein SAMN05216405_2904 [Lachnospiraceae bacterium NLAE-zl-G231]|nr:hypothetical protein SAMN05216405_2904 [Lachnospiraceae bacterium NLAE-zl-G231]